MTKRNWSAKRAQRRKQNAHKKHVRRSIKSNLHKVRRDIRSTLALEAKQERLKELRAEFLKDKDYVLRKARLALRREDEEDRRLQRSNRRAEKKKEKLTQL